MYKSKFLILIGLILFVSAGKVAAQPEIKRKAYTYATLIKDGGIDTGTDGLEFEYTVKKHTQKMLSKVKNVYLVVGDKFKLEYDSLNSEDAKILFEEPLFLPSEKTDDTEGTLREVHKTYCLYSYYHNREFKKIQYYKEGTVEKYNLKKGDTFEVDFVIGFPTRAIIYFNKPY